MAVTFDAFVLGRGPALVRFAHAVCGDRHLAEDLVQEVLARCARRWSSLGDAPEPYIRRAIVREAVSWRRRRSSTERPGPVPDRPEPSDGEAIVGRDPVWRALAGLPARQRAVLVLRHYEALPDEQIAELLGVRRATVRSLAARGAATLRQDPNLTDHRTTETESRP